MLPVVGSANTDRYESPSFRGEAVLGASAAAGKTSQHVLGAESSLVSRKEAPATKKKDHSSSIVIVVRPSFLLYTSILLYKTALQAPCISVRATVPLSLV